jgi:[acyl-carrier-protein] S-malonyltransferase
VLAILAPGQGSQRPGQLLPWLELPGAPDLVGHWSQLAGRDLLAAGTTANADEIRATEVAQPLLAVTALLAARALRGRPDVVTGHSVGGWAAAAIAGVLTEDDAVRLVAARGRAVSDCCDGSTGMAAILGGSGALDAIAAHGLTAANVNGAGQVVAAGPRDLLATLSVPGGRVRALPVAGAFHSPAMAPAIPVLAAAAANVRAAAPQTLLVADTDGSLVTDGPAHLRVLVAATAQPVRFDLVWERLVALGVDTVVELAPAGVLAGLAARCLPGVRVVKSDSPEALQLVHT